MISIIKDLQPIAFFISALLVLAVFLKDDPLHQKYALFASISFFLAYLGLASYKMTKYNIFFYWGLSLILIGRYYIYDSFGGIVSVISDVGDKNFQFIIQSVIVSFSIIAPRYLIDFSNKNTLSKFSNVIFWIGVIFISIFVYSNVYLNISIIGLYFGISFLLLCVIISSFNIGFNIAKNWLKNKEYIYRVLNSEILKIHKYE